MRFLTTTVLACLMPSLAFAQSLTLITDGEPSAQIALPADAHEIETQAADELNAYLEKITGTKLPITSEPDEAIATVWIGPPDEDSALALDLASLAFDGFVVDCEGERLILAGNCPRGTRNAVYWVLEELLGVRWFIPTELGENVPQSNTVTIPALRRREEPRFVNRRNHGVDTSIVGEGAKWRDRIRITDHSYAIPFNRYSHWLYRVFPVSKYGETHPEYYPLIGGERRIPSSDSAQNWQPCTSNPEVIAETIEYGKQWFADNPEANFLSVGMNDSGAFCECDNCTALDIADETFRGQTMLSDRYFTFVKAVADGLRDDYPDKYVSAIAYWTVESPPKRVELPDNTMVVITQDIAQWHDPKYKQTDMDFAREWADARGEFGTYDYTGLGWLMPRVYPHAMAESLRFYDEIGAVAVTNEAWPTWWYAGPQMYLRAKLMWDPSQDSDAVLNDFYGGFFGPAQGPMKRFYDTLERVMMKPREGRWFEGLGSVLQQMDIWQPADLRACRSALTRAAELAAGDALIEPRVQFVARGFAWSGAMLEEYWQAQVVREPSRPGPAGAADHLATVRLLLDRTNRREQAWASITDDELISGIYNSITMTHSGRLASWRNYVEASLTQGVTTLLGRGDEIAAADLAELSAAAPERIAVAIRTQQWAEANPDAPNLCNNPGFEETKADGPTPEGVDWVSTDAPPAWSKWVIDDGTIDQLEWESTGGHDGARCVRIAGIRNGCFIQAVPVEPGEVCYASAWVKTTPSNEFKVNLGVRWQDPNGAWTADASDRFAITTGGPDAWRKLSVVVTVPEGAGFAVILPGTVDQKPDDAVWYDDIRFIKLPDGALD